MGRNHLQEQQVPKDPTIYSPGHATQQDHRVLASVSRGYPRLQGSLITFYSPVRHFTRLAAFTCDLHASSTPPTFVLSQDQTLHLECSSIQCLTRTSVQIGWPALAASHPAAAGFFAHTLDFEATRYAKDLPRREAVPRKRARKRSDTSLPVKVRQRNPRGRRRRLGDAGRWPLQRRSQQEGKGAELSGLPAVPEHVPARCPTARNCPPAVPPRAAQRESRTLTLA